VKDPADERDLELHPVEHQPAGVGADLAAQVPHEGGEPARTYTMLF